MTDSYIRSLRIESAEGDERGVFEMTLATEGEASDGHILSIDGARVGERIPLLADHYPGAASVLGSVTDARKVDGSLKATGRINLNGDDSLSEIRRGIAQLIQDGDLSAVSVRWDSDTMPTPRRELPEDHPHHVSADEPNPVKSNGLFFEEWRALEGSVVAIGADPGALIGRAEACESPFARAFFRAASGEPGKVERQMADLQARIEALEDAQEDYEIHPSASITADVEEEDERGHGPRDAEPVEPEGSAPIELIRDSFESFEVKLSETLKELTGKT